MPGLTGLASKVGSAASKYNAAKAKVAPPGSGSRSAAMMQGARSARARSPRQSGGGGGQRAWQGTNREALGGINVGHDWRTFQTRQVSANNAVGNWLGNQIGGMAQNKIGGWIDATYERNNPVQGPLRPPITPNAGLRPRMQTPPAFPNVGLPPVGRGIAKAGSSAPTGVIGTQFGGPATVNPLSQSVQMGATRNVSQRNSNFYQQAGTGQQAVTDVEESGGDVWNDPRTRPAGANPVAIYKSSLEWK